MDGMLNTAGKIGFYWHYSHARVAFITSAEMILMHTRAHSFTFLSLLDDMHSIICVHSE